MSRISSIDFISQSYKSQLAEAFNGYLFGAFYSWFLLINYRLNVSFEREIKIEQSYENIL